MRNDIMDIMVYVNNNLKGLYATWCVVWIVRVPHINAMLKPQRCSLTNSEACNFCRYATQYYTLWIATSLTCGGVLKMVKMSKLIAKRRTFETWGMVVPYLGLGYSLEHVVQNMVLLKHEAY
jgi:hypothetical protein